MDQPATEQDQVDREVAWSRSRLLADEARVQRESSEMSRWAAERERAYTLFLSLRSMRAIAQSFRGRCALTRQRVLVQLRNASLICERARELQRHAQIAVGSSAGTRRGVEDGDESSGQFKEIARAAG